MSVQVKRRRDTAANLAGFIGAQAELLVDTSNNRVQVHDGATAGGWPAAKLAEVLTNTRSAIADADCTVLSSDRTIAFTSLSAARVVTLPAASAFPTGTPLLVVDESGSASATKTITIARAGSDTIDGATSAVISSAYGFVAIQSSGASKWTIVAQALSDLPGIGIGTPIDPANPLSVFGTSALFNSSGDIRVTLNKAASTNTASFLYQDGLSGRAEIGLTGDDNFHFKVSPDGSTWNQAIVIDATSGNVGIGTPTPTTTLEVTANTISTARGLTISQISNDAASAIVNLRKARGSFGALSVASTGDFISTVGFEPYDGTNFLNTSGFGARVNGTVTAGSVPADLFFYTSGGANDTNPYLNGHVRLIVTAIGKVGIGTTTPAQTLDVNGAIAIGSALAFGSDRSVYIGAYTVAALPTPGTPGRVAYASNGRMFNGTGTLEGAGAGTGGLVVDNGTAWKIVGTNQTVQT